VYKNVFKGNLNKMNKDKIIVVKDFLSKEYQLHLQKLIETTELPLYFNFTTMQHPYVDTGYPTTNVIESPQFTHVFVRERKVSSDWWRKVEVIQSFLCEKDSGILPTQLERCKLNFNPNMANATPNQHYTIHTDKKNVEGITGIYYVNDSDGDTLFFNEAGTEVIKRLSPKQGTMVYFNNKIPHAGQPPKINNYRAVINFNWN
jgi:hypothetical protein